MELSELRNFDYIVLFLIILSSYFGGSKGFIKSFIDFFAWVGSAIIVFDSYNFLFNLLNSYIPSKFICGFIASFGFYVALLIGISYLGNRIVDTTSKICGSNVDKTLGLFFGIFRGVIVVCAIFWSCNAVLNALDDKKLPDWFLEAKSYKSLKIGSDTILDLTVSDESREKIANFLERKSNKLEDEIKNIEEQKKSKKNSKKQEESEEE